MFSERFIRIAGWIGILAVPIVLAASDAPAPEPPSPAIDGTLPALTEIAGHGLMDSHAFQYLEELSDDIGGRVTGSPQGKEAIEWGLAKMKAIGLQNVHAETFQLSRGWTRGPASAELLEPIRRPLLVSSLGWVGSTPPGGVDAEVVAVNAYQLDDEMKQDAPSWAGKVLLVEHPGEPPKERSGEFGKFGRFLNVAYAAHAVAVIGGQGGSESTGMRLTHTGTLGFDKLYDIPVVSMAPEDEKQLERLLERGKPVRVHIDVENQVTDHPVETANVVGEIPGTEHPEQVLVVGGHLDSWDLAEGSTDDGTGVACVLGAAEAILRSGDKPRRTIRFVLFTGEEQGLLGSLAYTRQHKAEMANHLGDLILDFGQGPVTGFSLGGRKDLIPAFKKFVDSLDGFGDLKVDDHVIFGTDTGPFSLAGLPGINMNQDFTEYRYTHHSAADTFDKVKQSTLTQNATLMALTAFWIADRPERFDSPLSSEQTAKVLVELKADRMLKAEGLWPFGDLGKEEEKPAKNP